MHQIICPLLVVTITLNLKDVFDLSNVSVSPVVKTNHLTVMFEIDEVESRLCVRPSSNRVFSYSASFNLCIHLHYREQRLKRWTCSCDWCLMPWLRECYIYQCRAGKAVYVLPLHSHVSASVLWSSVVLTLEQTKWKECNEI